MRRNRIKCLDCGMGILANPPRGVVTYAERGVCRKCARKNRRRLAKIGYHRRREANRASKKHVAP